MLSMNYFYFLLGFMVILLLCMGCSKNDSSFTERAGFKLYFSQNKPSESLPTTAEQQLLEKYKPRVFLAHDQTSFVDFYDDYIANGSLYLNDRLVSRNVSQALLNKHKGTVKAEFRYQPSRARVAKKSPQPTVYGRVHQENAMHNDERLSLTFLSYNLVFANSGLVKGLASWQRLAMGVINGNKDWHQLDHYVGLTVTLKDNKPIAVMLQQHNYQTTWLVADKNSDNTVALDETGRVSVDVAMQSNELYLHSSLITKHPGLSFINESSIEFSKTGKNKPMMAGWDITHGEKEQDYALKFLPSADAFYTFKGKLGEGRKLPGRDGPPGADYATLPDLMPFTNRMVSGYRPRDIDTEKKKIKGLFHEKSFSINTQGLAMYKQDFFTDFNKLRK